MKKTHIFRRLSLLVLGTLLAMAPLTARDRDAADGIREKRYSGSVSFSYRYVLDFGLQTRHGVYYERSRVFLGAELWYRDGLDGQSTEAGFVPRWSFVSGRWGDAFLGAAVGLGYSYYRHDGPGDETEKGYVYFSPEAGIGFRVGRNKYIDLSVGVPLELLFYGRRKIFHEVQPVQVPDFALGGQFAWFAVGFRF